MDGPDTYIPGWACYSAFVRVALGFSWWVDGAGLLVEFGGKAIEPFLRSSVVAGSVADDPRSIVQATDDDHHLVVRDGDGDFGLFFYHLAYPVNPGRWYVPGTELLRCCDSSSSNSLAQASHRGKLTVREAGQLT